MAKKKETPLTLLRQQFNAFKRGGGVLPPAYGLEVCYVCGRKTHAKNLRYIGRGKDGESVYRHEQCEAGSLSWYRNMPNSSVRKYFPKDPNDLNNGSGQGDG